MTTKGVDVTQRPRLLELCPCQGGATRGYQEAGWYVIAVDIVDHSDVNPADEFYVMDALDGLEKFAGTVDVAHTSPPCWRYTQGNAANDVSHHPDLIGAHRDALVASGLPFIIENVPRSPLVDPVTLCGTQFGLTTTDDDGVELHLRRHRWFESNMPISAPGPCVHPRGVQWAGCYGGARRDKDEARNVRHGGYVPPRPVLDRLMGIDWMDEYGLFQALPPAYTKHLGTQLLSLLGREDAIA